MKLHLYITDSPENEINKNLYEETIFDVKITLLTDYLEPEIKLISHEPLHHFNYAQIPYFKRYYYINSIDVKNNNIYTLNLKVDVLESFKQDILNSKSVQIAEQTDITLEHKYSDVALSDEVSYIITTLGSD